MTILLLYLIWQDNGTSFDIYGFLPFAKDDPDIDCRPFFRPERLVYGQGDGSFSIDSSKPDERLEEVSDLLEIYCRQGSLYQQISEEQYVEAVANYESSVLFWQCALPFEDFCGFLDVDPPDGDYPVYIKSLTVSLAAPDSVFVYDSVNDRYVRIISEAGTVQPLRPYTFGSGVYYSADVVLGCASKALLPISETSSLSDIDCSDAEERDESRRIEMARAVFGDTFDFVRRITDSFGTVTYMYGFGQKTLTVRSDGSYEYGSEVSGESGGFSADFQTAVNFVDECGGWDINSDRQPDYRLVYIEESGTGKNKEYSFGFTACIDGIPIYSEGIMPVMVRVTQGEVSYYGRNTFSIEKREQNKPDQVSDAANLLAANANFMYKIMNDDALSVNTDEALSAVSDRLLSMEMAYFRSENSETLRPCWAVETEGGCCFFFDLYSAAPLGFSR